MCYLGERFLIMCYLGEECGDNLLTTSLTFSTPGFDTVLPWGEMGLLRVCFILYVTVLWTKKTTFVNVLRGKD